ncbi:MAG: hypothetical protein A4E37_01330 [Methanoregulaceae archaeon PtaB.Bin056]|nr:MAG: hypothetical protein A4E37_01330 [Methanoregulaceae archaeon PtaB.Bin056]
MTAFTRCDPWSCFAWLMIPRTLPRVICRIPIQMAMIIREVTSGPCPAACPPMFRCLENRMGDHGRENPKNSLKRIPNTMLEMLAFRRTFRSLVPSSPFMNLWRPMLSARRIAP